MESSRQIEDRAAAWLAQRDSGQWGDSEARELTEWLRASVTHRVAFLRLEAGWERSARLKTFGVGAQFTHVPSTTEWGASPFFTQQLKSPRTKRFAWGARSAALAASVLLIAAAALYAGLFRSGDHYTTPVGGVASIPLRDGSKLTLNTASKVHVVLNKSERRIELESGEAFFEVAKDTQRPFVVAAGDKRIVAVGTQFSVRWDGDDIQVIVTEGKVAISSADAFESVAMAGSHVKEQGRLPPDAVLATAGAVVRAADAGVTVKNKAVADAEELLSWRGGYLTFDETSLSDAVAEFNRYTRRKIVIEDPQLAVVRINGKFRATNSDDFILLLRNGFNIQAHGTAETIRLTAN